MSKSRLIQSKNIVISTQCFPPEIGGIENLMEGLSNSLLKNKLNLYLNFLLNTSVYLLIIKTKNNICLNGFLPLVDTFF